MPRWVERIGEGLHLAVFALLLVLALPIVLLKFGVDSLRDRIERKWPDSERARAISFWIGFLWPFVLVVVSSLVFWLTLQYIRSLKNAT